MDAMPHKDDDENRWPTVNLKDDQLEQVLATDVVETVRIDNAMRMVLDRLEGKTTPPPRQVSYAAPILSCTVAIVSGAIALLLDSGFSSADGGNAGRVAFGALAVAAAITSILLLIRARRGR